MTYNRKYIGARYVPKFADPIEWDSSQTYEPLTIVTYNGSSYTSRQYVPTRIDITDEDFWARTGDFNFQLREIEEELSDIEATLGNIEYDLDHWEDSLDEKFPVTIPDGGTGSTEFENSSFVMSNSDASALVSADSDDIVAAIGDTPVSRAICDEEGNNIIETYARIDSEGGGGSGGLDLEIITDWRLIFGNVLSLNGNMKSCEKFKFVRFGKICLLSAWVTIRNDVYNNNVFQRLFNAFKHYIPVATLPNVSVEEYAHCTYDDIDGRKYSCITDTGEYRWLNFVCKGYDINDLPKANDEVYIEIMYICE